ncbi:hypothetical protein [Hydrogenophaga sp.]|uniref:hypothetical protein n=1 Tax=Hydrogenophaga sp. TaxID=1904254 RepID=UPI0027347928|nr:hypothetical protein [Hydrogenophaga sp.]MDP3887014.1 hypothetical protein [Hydrogenophaga sp.]
MTQTRRLAIRIGLIALTALALAACETNPAKPEPAKTVAAAPAPAKSLVEMQYELDKAAMELETTQTMALIKFADESKSDFAKGVVAGRIMNSGGQAPQAAPRQSFVQVAQQQQRQAAEIELRTKELEERNSLWNKGLQVFDRAVGYRMFSKGLEQQRYSLDASNSQQRYLFDNLRGTQQDAYYFSQSAYSLGADATLGGVAAGRLPPPAAPAEPAPAPAPATPAE